MTRLQRLWALMAVGLCLALAECTRGDTEALNWNLEGRTDITCIYGQITPLASIPNIYFCGAQWGGVGGYCGIQHNSDTERRTIFSIWDTSPKLRPTVAEADAKTVFNRFGGEGEGAHTHMIWNWKYGQTFQLFLRKTPGTVRHTTDTRYYIFDPAGKKWRAIAAINSPNGKHGRGATFIDICSWIENFGGKDFDKPKVALYGLWVGKVPQAMTHVTRSGGQSGSGRWGVLNGTHFLAEGSKEKLAAFFATVKAKFGASTFGKDDKELPPITKKPLPAELIRQLKDLPKAPAVTGSNARQ